MKNTIKLFGIIAMVAIIALSTVSCDLFFSDDNTEYTPMSIVPNAGWTQELQLGSGTSEVWLAFPIAGGTTYTIHVLDWDRRSSLADVVISGKIQGESSFTFTNSDQINRDVIITGSGVGVYLVRVTSYNQGSRFNDGRFRIAVTTTGVRPASPY